jgi:hypothetical protein
MTSTGEEGGWFREMFAVDGVTTEGRGKTESGTCVRPGKLGRSGAAPLHGWEAEGGVVVTRSGVAGRKCLLWMVLRRRARGKTEWGTPVL